MLAENVVRLNNNEVYECIQSFFKDQNKRRDKDVSRTRQSYEANIRQFFEITRNKQIEHLTVSDLDYKRVEAVNYRSHLVENMNYSNATINQKMTTIVQLFKFLSANDYKVNVDTFRLKRLKEISNPYGTLTLDEAEKMADAVFVTEKRKTLIKNLLIRFAIRTSYRKETCLDVTWDDFEPVQGVYKVECITKGEKEKDQAVSEKFYNELLQLKDIEDPKWKGKSNVVFKLTKDEVSGMMERLREHMGFSEKRNIVFHSFRNVGINYELETTGDIVRAAQQGGHESIETTHKHYLNKNKDYTIFAGVRMDEEIDLNFLDEMDLDMFKRFIKQSGLKTKSDIKKFYETSQK